MTDSKNCCSCCECNEDEAQGFPLIGDQFPDISIHSTHGRLNFPEVLKDKWTVLFSHPADFTPVCTTEFVSFAKHAPEFEKINTQLIGLSIDQVFSHLKWTEWIKEKLDVEIPFPIIADNTGRMGKKLGMIHEKQGTDTVRAVFIMDPKAKIRLILYYPQEIGRNMAEILRAVKALQVSAKEKSAVPANWPENELVGDHVIVPPANTEAEAAKRRGKDGCYDWWFCHREMTKTSK